MKIEPYKGVRDFYPSEMAIQNYIFSVWRSVAEKFGYVEYSASILEYAELYRNKGSDEIVNDQMYVFKDKGDREVALRPEMTPTLARMIAAQRRSLKFPLRWYSVPNVFRYERPQRGRRREHWQLNCDLMGIAGLEAEVEIISLALSIMKAFGAKDEDFQIQLNDRAHSETEVLKLLKDSSDLSNAMRLIDKANKIPKEEFSAEWVKLSDKPFTIPAGEHLNGLLSKLREKGIENIVYAPEVVRGFDYYTGMVFEVFDTNPENRRSLFGGGRYDNLLEMFGVEPVPTVGFGMGDVTVLDFLTTHNLPLKK
ncbi:MAG: ATP phosphoribosyltransferase regulatory subunit [Candidatus Paceibacterota bacterium]|jgi:histidyl-tRNA synthetase